MCDKRGDIGVAMVGGDAQTYFFSIFSKLWNWASLRILTVKIQIKQSLKKSKIYDIDMGVVRVGGDAQWI